MRRALRSNERRIGFATPEGKEYRLGEQVATTMVRPRGWHLDEEHLEYDGSPVPVSLVDFGLYFFHCAQRQIDAGHEPCFYLPKLENQYEARLWNDIFLLAQGLLGIPRGTVRATVLIETITAAFEMERTFHELREHSAGAQRRTLRLPVQSDQDVRPPHRLPPARPGQGHDDGPSSCGHTPNSSCAPATSVAPTPSVVRPPRCPGRTPANEAALAKVRLDKEREAADGFDGSWVAHPALVPVCREVFDRVLDDRPNQRVRTRDDVEVAPAGLLSVRKLSGPLTSEGVHTNISVTLRCFAAWLRGQGVVAINRLIEDAATAEIARVQIWLWLRHRDIDREAVEQILDEEIIALSAEPSTPRPRCSGGWWRRVCSAGRPAAVSTPTTRVEGLVRRGLRGPRRCRGEGPRGATGRGREVRVRCFPPFACPFDTLLLTFRMLDGALPFAAPPRRLAAAAGSPRPPGGVS